MQAIERITPQAVPRSPGAVRDTILRLERLAVLAVELLALAGLCLGVAGLLSGLAVLSG